MSAAPVGAVVRIYYDGRPVYPDDCLRTPTGRCYLVVSVRVQARGRYVGRQHLACIVARSPPLTSRVLPLFWYARSRRRAFTPKAS